MTPGAYFEPAPLPVAHDDLLDAFMAGNDAEFDRLSALYYPEGSDDD